MENKDILRFHVVIAAAGQGERFGGDTPKQYALLAGKPVLQHAVDFFQTLDPFRLSQQECALASLTVAVHPDHHMYYKNIQSMGDLRIINGSDTRRSSVFSALTNLPDIKDQEIIVIHDAARPNISHNAFIELIRTLKEYDSATLALPVSDTLRRGEDMVDREGLWALQTPQAFRYGILKKAHETIQGNYTDDTGLVSAMGIPVKQVPGSRSNIKITVPEDLLILEKLMTQTDIRTGTGFDVHAFSKTPGRKLILCGVHIDHPFGLEGHSDADAGLHALVDAMLGAVGEGDIGQHFPPSDPKFKNMDSRIFVKETLKILELKNAVIQNADITLICENPKISPYREEMKNTVASLLNTDPSRVNIKATTTEGLGFTGRGEGIAAQAVVTVKL